MTYEFHPHAQLEYREAASFYENRSAGLGVAFTLDVEETITRIVEAPERWRIIEDDVRRCLTRTFPYGILYTIEPESILIIAVMHLRRQPGYWRSRRR
ncbi:MAG TPA: type II toxin-antitoxin system RelE/ParE family toxin [Pyrinomonadaceae bacterium]|nr:type II toxin-antitoxin system RelE/ParE family toxin [Pyrinomonadaceae bacterium]